MNELAPIIRAVAPEAASVELLQHCPAWPVPGDTLAYASLGRDLRIRDELIRLGRWHGEYRPTIVFVDKPTLPLLLHELAHCLPLREPLSDIVPTDEQRAFQEADMHAWATRRQAPTLPWAGHELPFIRRAIHLAYRASLAGIAAGLHQMQIAGYQYGLSHVSSYRDALGSEPAQCLSSSFAAIDARPMPPRFVQLFARDVATYHHARTLETYA